MKAPLMKLPRLILALPALGLLALQFNNVAAAAVNSWKDPVTGNWHDPEKWSLGHVPEADESVSITGDGEYTVNLSTDATISGLTLGGTTGGQTLNFTASTLNLTGAGTVTGTGLLQMSGGTLTGTGDLSIASRFDWIGGVISGSGAFVVASGGTLKLLTAAKTLDGRTLLNNGTVVSLDGSTEVALRNGAQVDNRAAFNIQGNANINLLAVGDGTGAFVNSGTVTKSVSSSSVTIQVAFNHTATVQVDTGSLRFTGGGTAGGNLNAATGATLGFAGGVHDLEGATLGGDGTIEVSAGTVQSTGDGASVSSGATFLISNSGTFGGDGPMAINGDFNWTGGTITGTGAFTINGGGEWNSGGAMNLDGRTLVISSTGTITWIKGNLLFANAAVLDNRGTFSIEVVSNQLLDDVGGAGDRSIINTGTFTRQGGAQSATIDVFFNNDGGTINGDSGTIIFTRGGVYTGNLNANGTGLLRLDAGIHEFKGTTLGGDGTIELKVGTLQVTTAGVTAGASTTFLQTSGTLEGAADFTVNGNFDWKGGTIQGTGGLFLNGGGTWNTTTHTLDGRTITVGTDGSILLTAGTVVVRNGGVIDNQGDFIIEIASGLTFDDQGGGAAFNNSGTLTKQTGGGLCTMEVPFNNSGTVHINRGEFSLTGAGNNTGPLNAGPDGILHFNSGSYTLAGVNLGGGGIIEVSGATLTMTGAGSTLASDTMLEFSSGTLTGDGPFTLNGAFEWRGGTISGAGAFTLNGNSTFLTSSTKVISGRTIDNHAIVTWTLGTVQLGAGAVFNNDTDGNFDMQGNLTLDDIGGSPVFNNLGTFSKSTGTGTGTIEPVFNNSGTLNASSGVLKFTGNSTHSAPINVTATLEFFTAVHTFDGVTFNGGGTVTMKSGTFTTAAAGGATVAAGTSFVFDGGTINGDGPLIFNGAFEWKTGTLTGTGALTINSAAIFTTTTKTLTTRTLDNHNVITWSGGTLQVGSGAIFNNHEEATFDVQGNLTLDDIGGNPVFNNFGVFTRSSGTGDAFIEPVFNNPGTLNINSGTLKFTGNSTHSAAINVTATLEFFTAVHTFDGVTFNGGGTVKMNSGSFITASPGGVTIPEGTTFMMLGGTLGGSGPLTSNGNFDWQAGTITGDGAFTLNSPATFSNTTKVLTARTLDNNSVITWSGGTLQVGSGAIINNHEEATFDVQGNLTLDDIGGSPVFNNFGVFTRSSGVGDAFIEPVFNNPGELNINSGVLKFTGNSTHSAAINVTATLEFLTAVHTFESVTFNGGGIVKMNSGSFITANPGGVTIPEGTTFMMLGGTLGGSGPLTSNGNFDWQAGTITGDGDFTLNSPATFTTTTKVLTTRMLDNNSVITWSGGTLQVGTGAIINNHEEATVDMQGNLTLDDIGGNPVFNNFGAFTRSSGTGDAFIEPVFNNPGTLNANSGALKFTGNSTHSAAINVTATLEFFTAVHTFEGVTFNGGGTVKMNSGSFITASPGGVTNPEGTTFMMLGGTLDGSGPLTSNGNFDWQAGTITGDGDFVLNGNSTFQNTTKLLNGRTLTNLKDVTWSLGTLQYANGALIDNQAGAAFNITGNVVLDDIGGGAAFNNAGTLAKTGGGGTATLEGAFGTSGVLNADNGTLRIVQPFVQTAGSTSLNGGNIQTDGGMTIAGGSLGGTGTLIGNVTVSGGTVQPGASAGRLTIQGSYTQGQGTTLELEVGGTTPGVDFDQLVVTGTATLNGTLALTSLNGFQAVNDTAFDLVTYGTRSGKFASLQASAISGAGQFVMTDYRANSLTLIVNNGAAILDPILAGFNGDDFQLTFLGAEGETYLVEFSTDLVEWTPLGTEVVAGGTIQFTHVNAAVNDHAFYRAILQLEP